MKPVVVSRTIAAPIDLVFQTISDPRNFQAAVPHIKQVEFLTDQQSGVGTKFRETRVMQGREDSVVRSLWPSQSSSTCRSSVSISSSPSYGIVWARLQGWESNDSVHSARETS